MEIVDSYMTRKNFIKNSVLGLLALPLISLIKPIKDTVPDYKFWTMGSGPCPPKLGYLSVNKVPPGTHCGDWAVYNENKPLKVDYIQSANDKTGEYEYYIIEDRYNGDFIHHKKILNRGYAQNLRFVYKGNNPNYKMYV